MFCQLSYGAGDSGQNLSMLSHSFRLPYVKWVFPSAPTRPISVNGGMPMPGEQHVFCSRPAIFHSLWQINQLIAVAI